MQHPSPPLARRILVLSLVLVLLLPTTTFPTAAEDRANDYYVEPGLEYVAIAPSYLARYLSPLIEWKLDRGVPAQIFHLEGIYGQYGGRDDAERVHNFLQDLYYNRTGGSPRWLLLAGDTDQVPLRYLFADRDHTGRTDVERNLYVGDTYYSGLSSDWDLDGDMVFGEIGEEDAEPELYVGRIAASLPEELEAAVAKTLEYELDPPGGDWFLNAFLAGALMDEPNYLDNPYTRPVDGMWTDEGFDPYTDNAYEVTQRVRAVMGAGYDFVDLADYPQFDGCNYSAAVDTLSPLSARNAWLRGNGLVFWACHGYEGFGGLAEYHGSGWEGIFEAVGPFITEEDTRDSSTGGMLPLVYISSCYAGQYDKADAKNFESMLTVRDGGAIGLVSGDGDTFRLENISVESFGNWWLAERFWQLVLREGMNRPGEALYELKREYHDHYMTEGPPHSDEIDLHYFYANLYAYNLQGDPEVPVWTSVPGRLQLEVARGAVAGAPALEVLVTNGTGEPVEDVRVFVREEGESATQEAVTGEDGVATFVPGPSRLGAELRLTATGEGLVPARGTVVVGEGERDLELTDEDVTGPTDLLFDGTVLEFTACVRNTGDFSASSVAVRLESGDPNAPDEEGVDGRYQTRAVDLGPGEVADVTLTHRYTEPGQYNVAIEVDPDDLYGEADEGNNRVTWQLLLRPVPGLPGTVGPIEVLAGRVHDWPLDLDFYVELPSGYPRDVSFELGEVTEGVGASIDEGNNLQLRPAADMFGTATVRVLMWTDGTLADEMTVLLEVMRANTPPLVEAPGNVTAQVGAALLVAMNASDPDGDDLTFATDLPGATVKDETFAWTPGEDDVGVHYVVVTVSDERGAEVEARFRVQVEWANRPPRFLPGQELFTIEEGERIRFAVTARDGDWDTLTYSLHASNIGFTIDPDTGLVTFDSGGLDPGSYSAKVVVTDGEERVERTVTVEVEGTTDVHVVFLIAVGFVLLIAVGAALVFKGG